MASRRPENKGAIGDDSRAPLRGHHEATSLPSVTGMANGPP